MKKILFLMLVVSAFPFTSERTISAQTKTKTTQAESNTSKIKIVVQKAGEPTGLPYDTGTLRLLVNSEDTGGAWALVEITERPGYKTPLHRHNQADEAFYVLEGVLTAKIADKTYELPAGSYILIPRGTPHAQGNLAKFR